MPKLALERAQQAGRNVTKATLNTPFVPFLRIVGCTCFNAIVLGHHSNPCEQGCWLITCLLITLRHLQGTPLHSPAYSTICRRAIHIEIRWQSCSQTQHTPPPTIGPVSALNGSMARLMTLSIVIRTVLLRSSVHSKCAASKTAAAKMYADVLALCSSLVPNCVAFLGQS